MTDQIPSEAIEAAEVAVEALDWNQAHGGSDPSTAEIVKAALTAALPFLRPEPSEAERETTIKSIMRALAGYGLHATQKDQIITDLLDAGLGFTRRPMPSRERLIGAIAGSECDWRDATPESIADAVLALFEKGAEG